MVENTQDNLSYESKGNVAQPNSVFGGIQYYTWLCHFWKISAVSYLCVQNLCLVL